VDQADVIRRLAALAAAAAAVLAPATATAAPRCPNADRRATTRDAAAMRAAVLCLVNRQRTSRHLPALHANLRLDHSAQGWTNHMVAAGVFSHGSHFAARISAAGYRWMNAGENIATGYPTPRAVVAAWMASTGHCHNILDPQFRDLGIGVLARPVRGYASGPATWTEDFGLQQGQRAPSHNFGPADGCPY
jgi:uncharacterized protein YkwD